MEVGTAAAEIFGTQLTNGARMYVNCGVPNTDSCLNHGFATTPPTDPLYGRLRQRAAQLACAGPSYFNSDFTIMKFTSIPGWEKARVGIGAQFFNVFNHPNFQQPIGDVANTRSSVRSSPPFRRRHPSSAPGWARTLLRG